MIRLIPPQVEHSGREWGAWRVRVGLPLSLAVCAFFPAASFLSAQEVRETQVPTIETKLTRVFTTEAPTQIRFPSLSPDGRWILFSTSGTYPQFTEEGLGYGLWLVPATGGEPIQLTQGGYFDDGPVWFPSGDQIAFKSSRPSRGENGGEYVMTLAIDPETGQPQGPPRQVSTERCYGYLDVSPDGESIVFRGTERAVLVVPSVGGKSRMVARAATMRPAWSPDGNEIYYVVSMGEGEERGLVRVSSDGAESDTVASWPGPIHTGTYPETRFLLRSISTRSRPRNHPSVWELATLDGRVLGRVELPPATDPFSFTPSGDLLAVRFDGEAPVEVLPIEGGSARRLSDTGNRDQVLGWSPRGNRVLFKTALDGRDRYFFAPIDGGPMEEVRLPEDPLPGFPPVLSMDGRHLLFAAAGTDSHGTLLKIFDLEDGDVRTVSEDASLPGRELELTGRGGVLWRDSGEFLFVEREDDRFEVRAVAPDGPSRLLRTFDGNLRGSIAVRGDWIAYSHFDNPNTPEERASVMLARAGDGPARAILTFQQGLLESFAWSPDGNRLALDTWNVEPDRPPPPWGLQLLVLEIDSAGEVIGEPILLDGPEGFWSWSPRWLPDGQGLLVQGEDGNIWRISSQPGGRPVEVTEALPSNNEVWDFRVSPDGRFIAYARGIFRGSSIWRVDLGDALTGAGR